MARLIDLDKHGAPVDLGDGEPAYITDEAVTYMGAHGQGSHIKLGPERFTLGTYEPKINGYRLNPA